MKRLFLSISLLVLSKLSAQGWATEDQYIQNFAKYAVEEMEKYKIPASITLAQGLLETGGGQSRLAQQGKNHFGIKCKEDWTGKTMKHTDDAPNECFRVYDDPRQSYEDHSIFLSTRKYYANLFKLDMKDYRAWATGLKKAGYATNPRYASILISKIEKYKLYEYDNTNSKEVLYAVLKMYPDLKDDRTFMAQLEPGKATKKAKEPVTVEVPYKQTSYAQQQKRVERIKTKAEILNSILIKSHPNDGLKYIIIPEDTNVQFIANKFKVSESRLMKWNELENEELKKNDIVFLESKNSAGNTATYKAESGEDMHDIAQKFGIKLHKLYAKNRMDEGQQPSAGQLIYLIDKKPRN
ncbi:LysM peptidoglycan-binding domain-containing protein [Chryseobacterium joostei]|uniref:Peptidoglycan hydrolase n=1 Tax=Chryseobacterium joostei TaxID=112234 RepID=A0A1N7I2X4_9FLAO|nr:MULTISPECIES: glucosaminidase domain-containing protein [Chryseobacterium]AZA99670.1 LysM peptidoglycan-binding domain-containing protein [Chryseobacterium joostei]SIS31406.1 Flagellum-specific peptidoglycan hydrolase FlgJ [Chryseobacterium joostei]HCM34590.1 LysM peptidoglycan-binding domain-containing protein [Chryseobacterium sp.]